LLRDVRGWMREVFPQVPVRVVMPVLRVLGVW
jgi:hypothetical protein